MCLHNFWLPFYLKPVSKITLLMSFCRTSLYCPRRRSEGLKYMASNYADIDFDKKKVIKANEEVHTNSAKPHTKIL